jgi:hypothetical protein
MTTAPCASDRERVAAARLRATLRRLDVLSAAWVTCALVAFPVVAVVGTRPALLMVMILVTAVPAFGYGWYTIQAVNARDALGEGAPKGDQHRFLSVALLLGIAWSTGLVVQQVTFDRTATHPAVATVDACDAPVGKNPWCSGVWTVDGRTYGSDEFVSARGGYTVGQQVDVLYPANDPSYVRRPGEVVGPGMIAGGIALLVTVPLAAVRLPRERRLRRRYAAEVRALAPA